MLYQHFSNLIWIWERERVRKRDRGREREKDWGLKLYVCDVVCLTKAIFFDSWLRRIYLLQ